MTRSRSPGVRSPWLIVLTLATWLVASVVSWRVFEPTVPSRWGEGVRWLLLSFHASWMVWWLWGIHNFWCQTLALFAPEARRHSVVRFESPATRVAVLYATCDDFDEDACASGLVQEGVDARLILCDDSTEQATRRRIDAWAGEQRVPVTVVRRNSRAGFKAGNLNHAIATLVDEEFFVVCDADELLPPDFSAGLLPAFASPRVAFAQARHIARTAGQSRFARLHGPSLDLFFRYCLPLRGRYGFVACFGHGVMVRRSAWAAIGGFPEIVSEDLAFAARALAHGYRGVHAPDVVAQEAFPATYSAFVERLRRVVRGTIEFFRREYPQLLRSREATWTEKLDVLMTFSYCYVGLVAMLNLVDGLALWWLNSGARGLNPWLWLIYLLGPHTPLAPLVVNVVRRPRRFVPFMVMAAVAYVSVMPELALSAVFPKLRSRRTAFDPTGRVGRQPQRAADHALASICGALLVACAFVALPPAVAAPTVCVGAMMLAGPALCFMDTPGWPGELARLLPVLPWFALAGVSLWATR